MKKTRLNLTYAISVLSFAMMGIPNAEAADIADGQTVTAPPQTSQAMNFTAPAPDGGGTFVLETGETFTGALTTDGGAVIGNLILDSGSTLIGAVGDPAI